LTQLILLEVPFKSKNSLDIMVIHYYIATRTRKYIYIYICMGESKERMHDELFIAYGTSWLFFFVDMVNCKRGSNQIHLRFD